MDRFISLYILFFLILGNIVFGYLNRKFSAEDTPIVKKDKSYRILHGLRFFLFFVWAVLFFLSETDKSWLKLFSASGTVRDYLRILGLVIFSLGGIWLLWSRWVLGKWFSTKFAIKKGHQIIRTGPYKIVRHPIYLGICLAIWGATLALDSLTTLIILAIPLPLTFYLNIIKEEKLFLKEMSAEYQKYQQEVPRLFPFIKTKART